MKGSEHDALWNQIEAEIHLHRHKTVIRACRGRKKPHETPPAPPPPELQEDDDSAMVARKKRGIGDPRIIKLHRDRSEGLGISITVSENCFFPTLQICSSFEIYAKSRANFKRYPTIW